MVPVKESWILSRQERQSTDTKPADHRIRGLFQGCRSRGNKFEEILVGVVAQGRERTFNLSLILRALLGAGTPREWKNRQGGLLLRLFLLLKCWDRPNRPPELRAFAVLSGF